MAPGDRVRARKAAEGGRLCLVLGGILASFLPPHMACFAWGQLRLCWAGGFCLSTTLPSILSGKFTSPFHDSLSVAPSWSVTFKITFSPFYPTDSSPLPTEPSKMLKAGMQTWGGGSRAGGAAQWNLGQGRLCSLGAGLWGRLPMVPLLLKKTSRIPF